MNITGSKILILFLIIVLFSACDESSELGLEVQPNSDKIVIFNNSLTQTGELPSFILETKSVDSLRSDEPSSLLLGSIDDPIFGENFCSFITQISLSQSNIDLGTNPVVDSVILSYSYAGYYGDLTSINNIQINYSDEKIYKDSEYYSNQDFSNFFNGAQDLLLDFTISPDSSSSPLLSMKLDNGIGQQILDLGNNNMVDNQTFQENFGSFWISNMSLTSNGIIYLNASGSNSSFTVYYNNDDNDSLQLNFNLDGESARVNLFNEKPLSNLVVNESRSYIQSMAGYKTKIELQNKNYIDSILLNKAINKVTLSFNVIEDGIYSPHQNLSLVRVDSSGDNVFLKDAPTPYGIEDAAHFGGELENNSYEFNITRFFSNYLVNDIYTNELYLLASGGVINANRTIIDNNSIIITILYSDL